ncbi:NlpC/P60 family protein [Aneurinibacillus sp. Ricciae_BoGa-3]|uniref:C40 family peptidase n=1 Tax=Aneurinibacillus sp. Ricciae_BoGa-3 TaxID=3022697 RepID=UPI00233FAF8A|nr:NlpC/P60 family protein [Aneurinibacillus sp. Ricciae_BoGa-3]WCK56659.1 NlpC/P60 family protein [Aneurinibacillus sp. Ricciae_BoGa-3]
MKKIIPLTFIGVLAFTNVAFAHSSYVPKFKVNAHAKVTTSAPSQQTDVQPSTAAPVQQAAMQPSAPAPVQQAVVQPSAPVYSANGVVQTAKSIVGRGHYAHTYDPAHLTFDCSGFTYYVFQQNGINLHSKSPAGQMSQGQYVPKSQLQPGDLVFFGSASHVQHVAIYVGNGQVVDAANSQRGVTYSNLSWSWYTNSYLTARRVR